jgi:phospholipid/cholesterol/gamma-HCH transport system substrate-binding protein
VSALNTLFTPEMTGDIRSTVANMSDVTADLKQISDNRKDELMAAISEIQTFTAMLSSNSSTIDSTLKSISGISETITRADLETSLASLRSSLNGLDTIVTGISRGEGSAGKLVTSDTLYTNLSNSLRSLDLLLRDLKENPKKYVHFSLFGRKTE